MSQQTIDIAILNAASLAGEAVLALLEERQFPVGQLSVLASDGDAGQAVGFRGRHFRAKSLSSFDFSGVALCMALEPLTASVRERIQAAGCALVEIQGDAPAAVAALNPLSVAAWVRNPLPALVAVAPVLVTIQTLFSLENISLTACLAASGRGQAGVEELAKQTAQLLNARPVEPVLFSQQLAFNLLAATETVEDDGHTVTERQFVTDLQHVLNAPALPIDVTCVQAPVFFGDSVAVSVRCANPVDIAVLRAALEKIEVLALLEDNEWPTAVSDAAGQDAISIGRMRVGLHNSKQLSFWLVADNVRYGIARNAVQLAELLFNLNK